MSRSSIKRALYPAALAWRLLNAFRKPIAQRRRKDVISVAIRPRGTDAHDTPRKFCRPKLRICYGNDAASAARHADA